MMRKPESEELPCTDDYTWLRTMARCRNARVIFAPILWPVRILDRFFRSYATRSGGEEMSPDDERSGTMQKRK